MSMSGPPAGPYPAGQPQNPWQGGQPHDSDSYAQSGEAYRQPTEPSGGPPAYGEPTRYDQPPAYGHQSDPQGGEPWRPATAETWGPPTTETWGPPTAEPGRPERSGSRVIITMVAVMAVLLFGAVATGVYLISNRGDGNRARTAPTAQPNPTTTAQAQPSSTASAGDNEGAGNDAVTAKVGDCLVNDGTNEAPKMRKITCAKDTFEVVRTFPATIDKAKCNGVPGYTHNYFFDSSIDTEDFVLCLKQRK